MGTITSCQECRAGWKHAPNSEMNHPGTTCQGGRPPCWAGAPRTTSGDASRPCRRWPVGTGCDQFPPRVVAGREPFDAGRLLVLEVGDKPDGLVLDVLDSDRSVLRGQAVAHRAAGGLPAVAREGDGHRAVRGGRAEDGVSRFSKAPGPCPDGSETRRARPASAPAVAAHHMRCAVEKPPRSRAMVGHPSCGYDAGKENSHASWTTRTGSSRVMTPSPDDPMATAINQHARDQATPAATVKLSSSRSSGSSAGSLAPLAAVAEPSAPGFSTATGLLR